MTKIPVLAALLGVLVGCAEERDIGATRPAVVDGGVIVIVEPPRDGGFVVRDGGSEVADGGEVDLCTEGPRKFRPTLSIVNGTRQPTLVPLPPEQIAAVVAIAGSRGGAFCSGTLISDTIVLTAQHCTVGEAPSAMQVRFGVDDLNPDLVVPVAAKLEHPTVDTALLTLAFAPATRIAVRPIPIYAGTLTRADEGTIVEQAGYGDTESSETGRFFATELLETVDARTFTVNGMGRQGVCFGDSGGPSLFIAPEGDVRVIGDLSEGDAECGRRDDFVRVDAIRPWIEALTGPTPPAGPVPCGDVTEVGTCSEGGAVATFCDAGELVSERCSEVCGWAGVGWRCVARASDPCGGLSHLGVCVDEVAHWCDRGMLRQRDCGACEETCLFLGDRIGIDCDPDPFACGELDYTGHCDGDVAEWCNEESQRERVDCAARGQRCAYVDAEIGYFCVE